MPDKKRSVRDWEDIRYFVSLARLGTLSATARTLRVNHATVARRIASLEALLGSPLFDRRPYGYALTAEGKAVLDHAGAMEHCALAVHQRLESGTELNGLVRVTAGRTLAERFIVDRLAQFHESHPHIDLEVIAENQVVSLARHEADIALRFGAPKDSALLTRRIATIALGLYASPGYRDRHDARAPVLIGYDEDSDFIPEASWLDQTFAGRRFAFRTTGQSAQAATAPSASSAELAWR